MDTPNMALRTSQLISSACTFGGWRFLDAAKTIGGFANKRATVWMIVWLRFGRTLATSFNTTR